MAQIVFWNSLYNFVVLILFSLYWQALLHGYHFRGNNESYSIAYIPRTARDFADSSLPQIAFLAVAYLRLIRFCPSWTYSLP